MAFELRCNSLEKPIYVFDKLERAIAGLRSWLIHDIGIYFWILDTSSGECVARASGARPELGGKKVPGRPVIIWRRSGTGERDKPATNSEETNG